MNAPHIAHTVPDAHAKEDAALVALLHLIAEDAGRHGETFVQARVTEAAMALDEHRAGLRLATPAASTGFVLRPAAPSAPDPRKAASKGAAEAAHAIYRNTPDRSTPLNTPLETGTQVRFMAPQGGLGPSVWAVKLGKVVATCQDADGKTSYGILSGTQLYEVVPTQILLVSTEGGSA